jgi:ATP-dependent DNA helicase DinG
MQRYKAGDAPIWLATGSAWTGIDITDKDVSAENDAAIKNLIIMKLPFEQPAGSNVNYNELVARCLIRLKQGIGRLVRRPGRKDMTLAILDGRLFKPKNNLTVIKRYLIDTYN